MKNLIGRENFKKAGVYIITNLINGKVYIGSTVRLQSRFGSHSSRLNRGVSDLVHIQRAYNKYGADNFTFGVLQVVDRPDNLTDAEFSTFITEIENKHIYQYKANNKLFGYNKRITAGSSLGVKFSEEVCTKLRGRKMSPENIKRQSGLNHHFAKPKELIIEAANLLKQGLRTIEICKKLNVEKSWVNFIRNGRHFSDITGFTKDNKPVAPRKRLYGEESHRSKLKESDVLDIVKHRQAGKRTEDIAKLFGVSKSTILYVLRGDSWSAVTGIKNNKRKLQPGMAVQLPLFCAQI